MSRRRKPPPARPRKPAQAPASASNTRPAAPRQPWLDALRGSAVLAMIAYHLGFDLNFLGWLQQNIDHDLRWQSARWLILGSFLFSVGASHALAEAQACPLRKHGQRIGKIALAAALVSGGSHWLFPQSTIWFGTLHAIAVMSLLLLALQKWQLSTASLLALAAATLAVGNLFTHPLFDTPALAWIGLMTHAPYTEDYVPLLPWFGICLSGKAFMQFNLQRASGQRMAHYHPPHALCWAGRHSLAIYLLHQPILLGILIPLSKLLKQG